jgi:multidrug resistance efflux pump
MDPLPPIPTPPAQRWREFRIQALPVLTFIAVLVCVVVMWDRYVVPANLIGEVESLRVNVISTVPGTLRELKVARFQHVSKGEEIAQISTMDPELFQAELRAIEAELRLLRARMQLDVERNLQNYELARLEFNKERVDHAIDKVNARLYESEAERMLSLTSNVVVKVGEQLVTNYPAASLSQYEAAARLAQTARTNVVEREKYLAEKEATLPRLAPATQADDVITASIAAQEEKLRAEQQMISLKSPIDGVISLVNFVPGAKIIRTNPSSSSVVCSPAASLATCGGLSVPCPSPET